jgi:predicted nucleic acid-binding protein
MGKIDTLIARVQGKRIYFDTNGLIYFFDKREPYFAPIAALIQACDRGECFGFTGDAAVAELMVHPYRSRDAAEIARAKTFFARKNCITVTGHNAAIFDTTSQLRASSGLKLIDALHYATAASQHCDFFLTRDKDFDVVASGSSVEIVRLVDLIDI